MEMRWRYTGGGGRDASVYKDARNWEDCPAIRAVLLSGMNSWEGFRSDDIMDEKSARTPMRL